MALKTFKPYTKSTRGTILVDRTGLWKGKPFKSLVSPKNSMKGRNNNGHITSINRAGGHKKMYRHIDFYRKKFDAPATVEMIEYDPNRSCYIMLVKFEDNSHAYYLAPQKIKVGDKVENGSKKEIKVGNCMPLQDIPVGIDIHNVELQPGAGGKIARSAGTSVSISGIDGACREPPTTGGGGVHGLEARHLHHGRGVRHACARAEHRLERCRDTDLVGDTLVRCGAAHQASQSGRVRGKRGRRRQGGAH